MTWTKTAKRGPQAGQRPPGSRTSTATARDAWGSVPAWVQVLAQACDGASQSVVARRIGYSAAVISQVINHSYRGDLARVEAAVRGALMDETVICPVLGDIAHDVCLAHQKRKFDCTSAMRARLYRACRSGCPHFLGGGRDDAE